MGKRERKIAVIQKYLKNVAGNWESYTYGKIPKSIAINACSAYAGTVELTNILGLIDITIRGNGKKGLLFTEHKIYYDNGVLGANGSVSYKSVYDRGSMPSGLLDSTYNTQALKELVSILAGIEGETAIGEINNRIDNLNEGVQSVVEVIGKGADLINSVLSIFDSDDSDEN